MNLIEIFERIWKRWWLILAILIVCILIATPFTTSVQHRATISFGMSYNNARLESVNIVDLAQAQVNLSNYLFSRMSSVEVQDLIAREADLPTDGLDERNPFYLVKDQKAGFVTLTFLSDDKEEATRFLEASKLAYYSVVNEWNEINPSVFDVQASTSFLDSNTEVGQPFQIKLLPPFIGLTVGLMISLLIPVKKTEAVTGKKPTAQKSKKTSKKS